MKEKKKEINWRIIIDSKEVAYNPNAEYLLSYLARQDR